MGRPKKQKEYTQVVQQEQGVPAEPHKKPIKVCFDCDEEMTEGYKMVALDKPYINLFFHKSCLARIESEEELIDYLTKKVDKIDDLCYNNTIKSDGRKSKIMTKGK